MNDLQLKIFTVIKAIIQIDNFDEYYKDHTIRYGVMNYVAKYSLANDKYLITQRCFDHLNKKQFLNNKGLRRGLKSKKNGFTYEHPIPSNRISKEIINERNDIKMVERILKWSDHIVVLTKEEDDSIKKVGLQSKGCPGQRGVRNSIQPPHRMALKSGRVLYLTFLYKN